MSLEQVLTDHSAALNNLAAAIREQIAAKPAEIVITNHVTKPSKFPDTIIGRTAEVITKSDPPTATAIKTELTEQEAADAIAAEAAGVGAEEPILSAEQESLMPLAGVTYDEMRSAFMKVPSKCGADVAREILAKFSCTKVPQVPAEHYAEVKRLSEDALAKAGK